MAGLHFLHNITSLLYEELKQDADVSVYLQTQTTPHTPPCIPPQNPPALPCECDVTFVMDDTQCVAASRARVSAQSEVLARMLDPHSSAFIESGQTEVRIRDAHSEAFAVFCEILHASNEKLHYRLLTNDLSQQDGDSAIDRCLQVLELSRRFLCSDVTERVSRFVEMHLLSFGNSAQVSADESPGLTVFSLTFLTWLFCFCRFWSSPCFSGAKISSRVRCVTCSRPTSASRPASKRSSSSSNRPSEATSSTPCKTNCCNWRHDFSPDRGKAMESLSVASGIMTPFKN